MTEVSARYVTGTTGPDPAAAALSQETNTVMKGWNDEAIDLAGKKAPDGSKTNLDIFNDALKGNPQDIQKAEDAMVKAGMSQEDADKATSKYMQMKAVDTHHNQIATDAAQKFEQGLSPEQKQQYNALKQSGDKKAVNEFENNAALSNPDLNRFVLLKRQAGGDVEHIHRQMGEINQAGNDVEKLKAVENTTTGVAMSPTEEAGVSSRPGEKTAPHYTPWSHREEGYTPGYSSPGQGRYGYTSGLPAGQREEGYTPGYLPPGQRSYGYTPGYPPGTTPQIPPES